MKKSYILFIFIMFAFIFESKATNPVISNYLVNMTAKISASAIEDGQPEMIISGNTIHVTWIMLESNNYKLYYCRSLDLGKNWENPRLIATFKYADRSFATNPSNRKLAVDGGNVHIAICDMDFNNGFASKVYYFRSTDGGTSFEAAKQLASKGGDGWFTAIHIKAANGKVAIVYKGTPNAKSGLFMLVSANNGTSFTETTISSNDVKLTDFWYDGTQMIVLYEFAGSDYRAWVAISNDSGATFNYTKLLNENGEEKTMRSFNEGHYARKIAKSGNNIHIVYSGYNKNNQWTALYALSTNNGQTFGKITDINNGLVAGSNIQMGMENVLAKNGQVYLAYLSKSSLLYLATSADNGTTVSASKSILPEGFAYVGATWYPGLAFDSSDATGKVIYAYGNGMISAKSTDGGKTFSNFTRLAPFFEYITFMASDLIIDSAGDKHWISEAQFWGGSDHDIFYRKLRPEPEPGSTNKSLSVTTVYDSKKEVVVVPSSPSLDFDSALTAEAWVKFDLASITENYDVSLFAKVNGTDAGNTNPNGFQVCLRKRFGKMSMNPGIETDKGDFVEPYVWSGEKGIGDTLWHHIAITYDAKAGIDNFRTYVDGLLVAKQTATGKLKQGNGLFMIGTRATLNQSSKLQIDDVRLWNRALSQDELLGNQVKTLTGHESGLKMFLNFNDSFKDISGNGNDGIPIYSFGMTASDFNPPIPDFDLYHNGNQVTLTNKTINGTKYLWGFGNNTTSDKGNPVYTYPAAGEYSISLEASNDNSKTVKVKKVSIAGLERISPTSAGNVGLASFKIYGGGINKQTTAKLVKDGEVILSDTSEFIQSGVLDITFDLTGLALGKWDVVVTISGVDYTLKEALEIEPEKVADPFLHVVGRNLVLLNTWHKKTIEFGNNGNVDIFNVPLFIAISDIPGLEVDFSNVSIIQHDYFKNLGYQDEINSLPLYAVKKDYFGAGKDARVYPFIVGNLSQGVSQTIIMRIKSPANYMFDVKIFGPGEGDLTKSNRTKNLNLLGDCLLESFYDNLLTISEMVLEFGIDALPIGCLTSTGEAIYHSYSHIRKGSDTQTVLFDACLDLTSMALNCAGDLYPPAKAYKVGLGLIDNFLDLGKSLYGTAKCFKYAWYKDSTFAVSSFDPNEMVGPSGAGEQNWIQKTSMIPYTILFENKKTATAPAHTVTVTDTLDLTKFDISKFGFGSFGWGDSVYYPAGLNLKEFSKDIDLRPGKNLIARVSGKLDTLRGVVTLEFLSLNPTTMDYEEDPLIGFLPPNATSPEGEGFVSFSVGLKESLGTNSQILNKAKIVFDANEPIFTNEYLNTLDLDKPQSQVYPLAANIKSNFEVSWTGSDQGSGIRDYTIFVLENDTLLYAWKANTTDLSDVFHGQVGSSYKFYSIATDNVSHLETDPGQYDATTLVTVDVDEFKLAKEALKVYPNPAKNQLTVTMAQAPVGVYVVELISADGSSKFSEIYRYSELAAGVKINLRGYSPGAYVVKVVYGSNTITQKVMVR